MNKKIATRFDLARRYLERIREAMRVRDPVRGMADAAELVFQAQTLYEEFKILNKTKNADRNL